MYDLDFRFRRALQPEGLQTLDHCIDALCDARSDARNAGADINRDPAIQLLTRRASRITNGTQDIPNSEDELLRAACVRKLEEFRHKPSIIPLVHRGANHDRESLTAFRREGQRTLRSIAYHLGLERSDYTLNYLQPRANMTGEHRLTSSIAIIEIYGSSWEANTAVAYWHPTKRGLDGQRKTIPIEAVSDMPKLARRIIRDLNLNHEPAQRAML